MLKLRLPMYVAAALMLMACASGTPPTRVPQIPMADPADLAPCSTLSPAPDGQLTTLLENHRQTAASYHACRDRHQRLADHLRSLRLLNQQGGTLTNSKEHKQ